MSPVEATLPELVKNEKLQEAYSLIEQRDQTVLNAQDPAGRTALHWAADKRNVDIVDALIQAGANLDIKDTKGNTALMLTVTYKYVEGRDERAPFGALLRAKANLNIQNTDGNTALMLTTMDDYYAYYLIKAGADPNISNKAGDTALILAVTYNYTTIALELIEAKANLNTQDGNKMTALHWAVRNNNFKIVKKLIDNDAERDIQDIDSYTPLMHAAINGRVKIAQALIAAKANLNLQADQTLVRKNKFGQEEPVATKGDTALMIALRKAKPKFDILTGDHTKIALTLIKAEADLTLKNSKKETAFSIAKDIKNSKIDKALREASAKKEKTPSGTQKRKKSAQAQPTTPAEKGAEKQPDPVGPEQQEA